MPNANSKSDLKATTQLYMVKENKTNRTSKSDLYTQKYESNHIRTMQNQAKREMKIMPVIQIGNNISVANKNNYLSKA